MVTGTVSARVRVRPVDSGRILGVSVYMGLVFDPAQPYEVRLVDPGMGELAFARELLDRALHPSPVDEAPAVGGVSLHLACLGTETVLVLQTYAPRARREFALPPKSAALFLARPYA